MSPLGNEVGLTSYLILKKVRYIVLDLTGNNNGIINGGYYINDVPNSCHCNSNGCDS